MLKIALILLLILAVAIVALLILAARKPDSFRISRSVLIKAKADKVFDLIDDFKAWPQWSPYETRDPGMTRTYGPISKGKGATYEWAGDNKTVGAGRMRITEAAAPYKLLIALEFLRPLKASNTAEFTLEPEGDAVKTTWAMFGPQRFTAKLMGMAWNMDKMVGKDFEAGLAKLKTVAEN